MAPDGEAFRALVRLLIRAHAGELAAFLAYEGHRRSLRDAAEALEIRAISEDELAHRRELRVVLDRLEHPPARLREALFWLIGTVIGALCRFGGWFAPMYGAGLLERGNVAEYERAAELALRAGQDVLVEPLLRMAAVESEHERYFRAKVESHWLSRVVGVWSAPSRAAGSAEALTETVSRAPARFEKRGLSGETAFARSRPVGARGTVPTLPALRDRS